MMKISVRVRGASELDNELSAMPSKFKVLTASAMNKLGQAIVNKVRHKIRNEPKTGLDYGGHRASAPGEAPAEITGVLAESYQHGLERGGLRVVVGSGDPKSAWLELGTSTVKPRPHLLPAADDVIKNSDDFFAVEMNKL